MRGRGSKAVWKFSENSSVLVPPPVPYVCQRFFLCGECLVDFLAIPFEIHHSSFTLHEYNSCFLLDPSQIMHCLAFSLSQSLNPRFEFWLNCWICQSWYMNFSKMLHGFLYIVTWICQNRYMHFYRLLYGFVKIDKWISQSCYMDLLKMLHGLVKVVVVVVVFLALCQNKTN